MAGLASAEDAKTNPLRASPAFERAGVGFIFRINRKYRTEANIDGK
jgi:hypothetical protein